MKAAVHTRYGPPEVVRVREVDRPAVGAGEILVRVRATTVNQTDCATRAARPFFMRFVTGLLRPRATVLGNEFAGEVEAIGAGVTSFAVGDRVFGYCEGPFGAHAEYLVVGADSPVARIPEGVSFEVAAAATEGLHYALAILRGTGVQRGDDVMVYGATGAIGSAAVQLAKQLEARVTAVCGTEHLELVRGLGPDRVVDYMATDFTEDDQAYDVVIDAVGKNTFGRCRRLLKPGGIYSPTDLGPWWQNPPLILLTRLLRGKRVMIPFPTEDQEMIRWFAELMESGEFKPVIDREYSLERIVEAYRYVETGQKIGNVVITVE